MLADIHSTVYTQKFLGQLRKSNITSRNSTGLINQHSLSFPNQTLNLSLTSYLQAHPARLCGPAHSLSHRIRYQNALMPAVGLPSARIHRCAETHVRVWLIRLCRDFDSVLVTSSHCLERKCRFFVPVNWAQRGRLAFSLLIKSVRTFLTSISRPLDNNPVAWLSWGCGIH